MVFRWILWFSGGSYGIPVCSSSNVHVQSPIWATDMQLGLCTGSPDPLLVTYVINRDYYMAIFISYPISTLDPYQPEGLWPLG